jgi:hypothetical protein
MEEPEMAKIGDGTKKQKQAPQEINVPTTNSGSVDYAALYDKMNENAVAKQSRTDVTAPDIREVIDGLFSAGKDQVAVATVEHMVNVLHNLKKDETGDNRIQNSSVRSAGTAGKKYIIDTTTGTAYFKKNADYVPPAPKQ